jgi:acid phosphatase type 7
MRYQLRRGNKFRFSHIGGGVCSVLLGLGFIAGQSAKPPSSPEAKAKGPDAQQTYVLVGAGDIVACQDQRGAAATAQLLENTPGAVFTLGDMVYDARNLAEFRSCYGPTWGKFKARTHPALGNHEYVAPAAGAYFAYWGAQAGPQSKGYYSYDLGDWHIVVLNTNCSSAGVGGCNVGSPQEVWLRQDLREHASSCVIAYGHHALFSSGIFKSHAVHAELKPLWEDLYAAHADLVLAGHEHTYERFSPQDPEGRSDPQHGIREIIVGTGGRSHNLLGIPTANSEVQDSETYGVLKLTLSPQGYTWEFLPEQGKSFHDSGTGICHNRAPQEARNKLRGPRSARPAAAILSNQRAAQKFPDLPAPRRAPVGPKSLIPASWKGWVRIQTPCDPHENVHRHLSRLV